MKTVLPDIAIPPRMPAFCQSQANTLAFLDLNLGLLSYDPLHSRDCSNSANASSRESTPPHARPDQIRKTRSYDRPGKKPAVPYRRDPLALQKECKRRGGCDFAVDWIMVAFQRGVSLGALVRTLDLAEVEDADWHSSHGFTLRQAYDGFLVKIGYHFECGLCKEGSRTHWVHKKDAVRHLRKFHFGLAERCRMWCVFFFFFMLLVYDRWKHASDLASYCDSCKNFYSASEMRRHCCVAGATQTTVATPSSGLLKLSIQ
jgi:hypothetical protein